MSISLKVYELSSLHLWLDSHVYHWTFERIRAKNGVQSALHPNKMTRLQLLVSTKFWLSSSLPPPPFSIMSNCESLTISFLLQP